MISQFIQNNFTRINSILDGKYWLLKATLFSVVGVLIFAPPNPYFYTSAYGGGLFGQKVIDRAENILNPPNYGEDVLHESKTYFRIFIPLLCKIFGIKTFQPVYILQNILGIASILLVYQLLQNILKDKVTALFLGLSFTFIYAGKAAFHDISGWFDAYAYFFLICALAAKQNYLRFIWLLCAFFVDERSLLSSLLVALYFLYSDKKNTTNFMNLPSPLYTIGFSILSYVLIRLALIYFWGFKNVIPNENLHLKHLTHTFWSGLEGIWILGLFSLFIIFYEKRYYFLISIIICLLLFIAMYLNIGDQTRSVAYIFPLLFVFSKIISGKMESYELRLISLIILFVTLLYPADFYINGFERSYFQPIYIKVLKTIFPNSIY